MVFFRFPCKKGFLCFSHEANEIDYFMVHRYAASYLGTSDFSLHCEGKKLLVGQEISQDATIYVTFSLPGGKGGFGSMLRAIGAQIEKTTNREACRDLSGRRLRDINEEQRLKKWIAKESERKADKIRRRKERIERLKSKPKHNFVDFEYEKEISQLPDRIDDALSAGIQKANKQPSEEGEASSSAVGSKRKCLWMDEEIPSSSSSDSDLPETTNSDSREAINSDSQSASCSDYQQDCSGIESRNDFPLQDQKPIINPDISETSSSSGSEKKPLNTNKEASNEQSMADYPTTVSTEKKVSEEITVTMVSQTSEITTAELKNKDSSEKALPIENEPIHLLDYENMSELEALGLDRLKYALMARGLKCGGTISDRVQRLWAVRNLQPSKYPTNLLAKKKK